MPVAPPQLLARFRVNRSDTLAVFRAVSTEDFADVASLLPPNTALPAADKMTYLLARLEVRNAECARASLQCMPPTVSRHVLAACVSHATQPIRWHVT